MLGSNLYRVENGIDMSNDELKSLSLFYRPLIGSHAFSLYMHLSYMPTFIGFKELNSLCRAMNVSIDKLEDMFSKLNRYKLLKTLKKEDEDQYILILNKPLDTNQFVRNNVYVRNFILNYGGENYQEILSSLKEYAPSHKGFKDVSVKLESDILNNWTEEDESYLHTKGEKIKYEIDSCFNVNEFLKQASSNLFPLRYRTYDNLKMIATLADLYNISPDKMLTYIPRVIRSGSDNFDARTLKNLCISSVSSYTAVDEGNYNVPCVLFFMNLQEGKEVSEYDRKILYNLSNSYNLNTVVINTLIEYHLKHYDNRIIEKILYSEASDLHRNNVKDHDSALLRLNGPSSIKKKTVNTPDYSLNSSEDIDLRKLDEFLKEREQ